MQEFLQNIKMFYMRPGDFFEKLVAEPNLSRHFWMYVLLTCIYFIAELIVGTAMRSDLSLPGVGMGFMVVLFLIGIPMGFLSMAIGAGIQAGIARLFGGKGSCKALICCYCWFVLTQWAILFVGVLLYLIAGSQEGIMQNLQTGLILNWPVFLLYAAFNLVAIVWLIALDILVLKKCFRLSTVKAALVLFLPFIVIGLLMLLIFLVYKQ